MILPVLALALCSASQEAKGRSFDVFGPDRERARRIAREADHVSARFREWFGKEPPRGAILLGEGDRKDRRLLAGGARWTWKWDGPEGAFLHELAHLLLVMTFGKKEGRYGSVLPDWIDEGFASQFDPPSQRRAYARVAATAFRRDSWMRFPDLFETVHPDSREGDTKKAGDRILWYAQTASVFRFLVSESGPEFFRDAAGIGMDRGLRRAAGLEEDWKSWASALGRLTFPPEEEIRRWSLQESGCERALEQVLDPGAWSDAFREIGDKLGGFGAEIEVTVLLGSWEGAHPAAATLEGDRGVVRFNARRLGDLQRKADGLETLRGTLPAGQKAVWKVPPLRLPRLIPHELMHLFQGRTATPGWLHEGLASWVGGDEHYLWAFRHQGKEVGFVDEAPAVYEDNYARGMLFFRWLEHKVRIEDLRRFARTSWVEGGGWKAGLEEVTGLSWERLREEERAWSGQHLRRLAP